MVGFLKYMKGYLRIKVWGLSPERFMNLCGNRGILLWEILRDGEVYYMNIGIGGFFKLRPIVKKTGTRVAILERYGLPFFLPVLQKRKIFLAGMLLSISFWLWSSLYIWDVELYGNYQITEDVFQGFLRERQITVGMRKEQLDIEELEKEIRRQFPQITWTSARLDGTRLKIDIKENDAPILQGETKNTVQGKDLTAEYEGIVTSMIVRSGIPKVAIGDRVEAGTVMVDGKIPVYQEDGTVREYQQVEADADIVLEHTRKCRWSQPFDYIKKEYTGRIRKRYFVRVGDKEWKLPQERPYLVYDSIIRQSRPLFFEKLSIPVFLGSITHREYQKVEHSYTKEEASLLLNEKLKDFLESLKEKGVQIIEKNVKIDSDGKTWVLEGELLVRERAGRSTDTVIPEDGEKEQDE